MVLRGSSGVKPVDYILQWSTKVLTSRLGPLVAAQKVGGPAGTTVVQETVAGGLAGPDWVLLATDRNGAMGRVSQDLGDRTGEEPLTVGEISPCSSELCG